MNFSEFNKTVRACALICLTLVLLTIIVNGSINTFLHPRSLPFIKASFFLLCGLSLYSFRKVTSSSSERVLNWKVCILFLPIALNVYVKPTGLSSRIAAQKGLASVAMASKLETDTARNQSDPTFRIRNACDTVQDDSLYVKLDRIYSNPSGNEGKKVTMIGFIAPDTLLGRHSFFIARMMVSCCAADAMPVGFYCVTDSVLGIDDGNWVVLSGQIETRTVKLPWDKEKRVLPILRVSGARKTAVPKRQYIYPVAY